MKNIFCSGIRRICLAAALYACAYADSLPAGDVSTGLTAQCQAANCSLSIAYSDGFSTADGISPSSITSGQGQFTEAASLEYDPQGASFPFSIVQLSALGFLEDTINTGPGAYISFDVSSIGSCLSTRQGEVWSDQPCTDDGAHFMQPIIGGTASIFMSINMTLALEDFGSVSDYQQFSVENVQVVQDAPLEFTPLAQQGVDPLVPAPEPATVLLLTLAGLAFAVLELKRKACAGRA